VAQHLLLSEVKVFEAVVGILLDLNVKLFPNFQTFTLPLLFVDLAMNDVFYTLFNLVDFSWLNH
jgi:hypothetical protein